VQCCGWSARVTEQVFRTTVVKTAGRVRRAAQRLLDADFPAASHTAR
jgi:hypothetical protein